MPDKGVGGGEVVDRGAGRGQPFERVGDAVEKRDEVAVWHGPVWHKRRRGGEGARTLSQRRRRRKRAMMPHDAPALPFS
jgi:hypothetical protein